MPVRANLPWIYSLWIYEHGWTDLHARSTKRMNNKMLTIRWWQTCSPINPSEPSKSSRKRRNRTVRSLSGFDCERGIRSGAFTFFSGIHAWYKGPFQLMRMCVGGTDITPNVGIGARPVSASRLLAPCHLKLCSHFVVGIWFLSILLGVLGGIIWGWKIRLRWDSTQRPHLGYGLFLCWVRSNWVDQWSE